MALPPQTGAPLFLYIPDFGYGTNPGDDTYDIPENANAVTINNFANSVILKNPVSGQTVTQPGSTLLSVNSPSIFGSPAILRFGTVPSDWDSSLSRVAAGSFTLDSSTPGDAQATLKLATANATAGFQINGTAPNNHLLVGNGTRYVDSATLPPGAANYQIVESNETPLTQRNALNVQAPLTAVDDAGNGSTDLGLAPTGVTPSDYISPNLSIDQWGRITEATNSVPPTITATVNDVTAERSFGVTYTNSSPNPIYVSGYGSQVSGMSVGQINGFIGPSTASMQVYAISPTATEVGGNTPFAMIVPAGWKYELQISGDMTGPTKWYETQLS